VSNFLPFLGYGRQTIAEEDRQAVLAGDYLIQGPEIECFELALAEYVGAKYAIAVSNGTAALHLACLVAGWTFFFILFYNLKQTSIFSNMIP
jgi:dTDP-4-amino-4,6-dideoxygalactose transaminase